MLTLELKQGEIVLKNPELPKEVEILCEVTIKTITAVEKRRNPISMIAIVDDIISALHSVYNGNIISQLIPDCVVYNYTYFPFIYKVGQHVQNNGQLNELFRAQLTSFMLLNYT